MTKELEELALKIAQTHDEDTFRELCKKMRPIINRVYHSYKFFYLEKEDFIQEAEWELLETCDTYNPNHDSASFFGYFHACLTWLAVKFVRSEHRKSLIPREKQVSIDHLTPLELQQLAIPAFVTPDLKEKTDEYVRRLSKRERKVFELWVDGKNANEIGVLLSLSYRQTISSINRCRQKFILYVVNG